MSDEKNYGLTAADRDRIIREVACNSELSKEAINEKAGIPPRSSRENRLLKPWIKENTSLVFGEKVCWKSVKSIGLRSMQDTLIIPDLVGTDSQGSLIIVEVKFKFNFPNDRDYLRRDVEKRAIGQILLYACAYMRDNPSTQIPRLFIVSIDFSEDVEYICEILRSKGFNICHLAIKNILSK